MNVRRLRTLCVEIYKTLNDLNNLDNLDTFKNLLKNWDGNLRKFNLCKNDIY